VSAFGGTNMPRYPVWLSGVWMAHDHWYNGRWDKEWPGLTTAAFQSMVRAGVFVMERRGPRGGKWYKLSGHLQWDAWREKYLARVEARLIGDASRRLARTA